MKLISKSILILFSIVFIESESSFDFPRNDSAAYSTYLTHVQKTFAIESNDNHGNYGNENYRHFVNAILDDNYKTALGHEPIFMYHLIVTAKSLGNHLGEYFEAMTCANLCGLHFIPYYPSNQHEESNGFLESLYTIQIHPDPSKSREEYINKIHQLCNPAGMFPWETTNSKVPSNTLQISSVLNNAISNYIAKSWDHYDTSKFDLSAFAEHRFPIFSSYPNSNNDNSGNNNSNHQPIIPDVTILFRCSDIIHHGRNINSPYGFLNFNVYRMIIPHDVKSIYVISEALGYNSGGDQDVNYCRIIGGYLLDFLSESFPSSFIGFRRGHPFQNLFLLSKSNIAICPPSTYCIWPAIARSNGALYYQKSYLCLGGVTEISKYFNWINYPPLVQFGDHERVYEDEKNLKMNITSVKMMLTSLSV
eukprot:gene12043-16116_t